MFVVSKCLSNLDTWILFVVLCQAAAGVAVESSPPVFSQLYADKNPPIFSRFSIDNDTSVVLRVIRVTKLFRDLAKKVEIAVKKGELVIRTTHSCLVACSFLIIILIIILPLLLRMMISPFCYSSIYRRIY